MGLLLGLKNVDWHAIEHAYGPAIDVPDLLLALVYPTSASKKIIDEALRNNRTVREHVIWTLWGNVFHQGTVWQATSHVIPFLFEILRDGPNDVELQEFLVSYLHHLALGYPADLFPQQIDPDTYYSGQSSAEVGDDPEADMAGYARSCFVAVESDLSTILRFVSSEYEPLALTSIACVADFRRKAPLTIEALNKVLETERNGERPLVLAAVLIALAQLGDLEAQQEAERWVQKDGSILSIHAACASVLSDAEKVSENAINVLRSPLGELSNSKTPFTDSLGALVSRSLAKLPAHRMEQVIKTIAEA